MLFQFACALSLAVEEAKDRQVNMGMERKIKMAGNWEFQQALPELANVERASLTALDLTDVNHIGSTEYNRRTFSI